MAPPDETKIREELAREQARLSELEEQRERVQARSDALRADYAVPRLAMAVSWKGTIVQYAGRLQRLHPSKTEVRVFDYVDRGVPVLLRMFEKRLRTYRAIGYARHVEREAVLDAVGSVLGGT